MSQFCGAYRTPRAGIDPVTSATAALAVVQLAMWMPPRFETIALLLDEDHRGRTVVVVAGTEEPDALIDVVERLADSMVGSGHDGALVVASIRPGGGLEPGDDDRWIEASDLADDAGVELLEWFVVTERPDRTTAWCPRDLLGEPPRWRR
ncbi:MAG: hypothetical protein ABW328_08710 [Ilumatobacteraceae bacterium]